MIKKQEQNQDIANRNLRKVGEELARVNRQFYELNKKLADQVFTQGKEEVIDASFASVNSRVDEHTIKIGRLTKVSNGFTGGEGAFTQWVHDEFMVSSEAICPPNTHWVHAGYF